MTTSHLAIVITGPVGSGKSATATELQELLGRALKANVLYDMDFLRATYPDPIGDPFSVNLGYRVMADAWKHMQASDYGEHGPLRIAVIADVVETQEQRACYEDALPPARVVIVRLEVEMAEIMRRLEIRESARTIEWYRRRAPELQALMVEREIGDLVIEVGNRSPEEVATQIARELDLL